MYLEPEMLWSLLALPLLVMGYRWLLRERKVTTLRYPGIALPKQAMRRRHSWQRRVPPVLILVATATLLLASARPTTNLRLPTQQRTIILARDVSVSISASDVAPNRLVAAQDAARAFLAELPSDVRVGVVGFAGSAALLQKPTLRRDAVLAAIDGLQLQPGTAIDTGIAMSVTTRFPTAWIDVTRAIRLKLSSRFTADDVHAEAIAPVAPGSYPWAAVVLLTDGQRTVGPDPIEASQLAAERGLRVYTIGLGTAKGRDISFDGWTVRVRLDEKTLRAIAARTGAEYFNAGHAQDLIAVYRSLGSRVVLARTQTELTGAVSFGAALLVAAAAALSIRWFG
ncbi:MAG: VWA domain-containing protein [Burkholderiales bacterium]